MSKKNFWVGMAGGCFLSGVLSVVVGKIDHNNTTIDVGAFLIVVFGIGFLIFALTRGK